MQQDSFDFTGNYTPNTTTEWHPVFSLGYQRKMKECNLSFRNVAFTLKRKIIILDVQTTVSISLRTLLRTSSSSNGRLVSKWPHEEAALEDLFLIHLLLSC